MRDNETSSVIAPANRLDSFQTGRGQGVREREPGRTWKTPRAEVMELRMQGARGARVYMMERQRGKSGTENADTCRRSPSRVRSVFIAQYVRVKRFPEAEGRTVQMD